MGCRWLRDICGVKSLKNGLQNTHPDYNFAGSEWAKCPKVSRFCPALSHFVGQIAHYPLENRPRILETRPHYPLRGWPFGLMATFPSGPLLAPTFNVDFLLQFQGKVAAVPVWPTYFSISLI